MGRKLSYPNQIAKLLVELSSKYPQVNIGKHLEVIQDNCSLEWLSDKELYEKLLEYMEKIDEAKDLIAVLDEQATAEIIEDGTHLFDLAESPTEE